jgi:hypothetical protein
VFVDENGRNPLSIWALEDRHKRMKRALKLPVDAVIHSFHNMFGTRLGESASNAFTMIRVMGHCTVIVSQKYVHPTPEAMEWVFERWNAANKKTLASPSAVTQSGLEVIPPATISTMQEAGHRELAKLFRINMRGWRNW